MVYTLLTGRIGNNLFQIATAAALAHRNGSALRACITDSWCQEPDNCSLADYLEQFKENLLRNIEFVKGKPENAIVFDQVNNADQIPYFNNICLHGLWQSDNYFKKEQDVIRELLSIDNDTERTIQSRFKHILDKEVISIVVRRGDYCKQPQYHPTCSMTYYKNAIRYFGQDKFYLIISDDIEWCKTKFKGSNFYFADHISPVIDFYLQTYCSHNVISNSTFAWWGAWLNESPGKVVIAPKENWYGYFYRQFHRKDMLPEEWIKLPNPLPFRHKIIVLRAILINALLPLKHTLEKLAGRKIKLIRTAGK